MSLLSDRRWKAKYKSGRDDLLRHFYEPALAAATRYDRATGFFSARVLTMAARGIEGLVRNQGHWRLVVGCQLKDQEVDAIDRGLDPAQAIALRLADMPLAPQSEEETAALELLSWLIARGSLEIRFAIPCDTNRRPLADGGMFHEKAGIVEDKTGDRLAFNGSVNETPSGWGRNWESFHAFTSWSGPDGQARVEAEELSFRELWNNDALHCLVVDLPDAVRDDLLRFLPADDQVPRRLEPSDAQGLRPVSPETATVPPAPAEAPDQRPLVWGLIEHGAALPVIGERVGEATSTVIPWPHQVRAFERMYRAWPPRLLIADEVGLGKTIEAGLVLRQAWLAGRLKRVLILAPKAVVKQWQIELREKFNLDWPVYDGDALQWLPTRVRGSEVTRRVSDRDWHREPFVITSSHLMRREGRARELVEGADPWDLVILDEAHHARRKGGGLTRDRRPNRLLELMQRLRDRTEGLLLLTATPMQVSPAEVWDLLSLLHMPAEWTDGAFVRFFEQAALPNPSAEQLEDLAHLFRAAEAAYGPLEEATAMRYTPGGSRLAARKILAALRDVAVTDRRRLETNRRRAAVAIMQAGSPVARLISRHTRELLRKYFREGRISTPVPDRIVQDVFIDLAPGERAVYERVEDYIATTYNAADPDRRNAVGFVMTIYRRRLASSFQALRETLSDRVLALERPADLTEVSAEDVADEDEAGDAAQEVDPESADALLMAANEVEERGTIASLLEAVQALPPDSKVDKLLEQLTRLRAEGRSQAMVFTQYTDTLDFLRDRLVEAGHRVMCFSGRGGERLAPGRRWTTVSREETKRLFAGGAADILLCTDAAAEGLNFQFCGALVNYDMPWNPMKVEQRIGRIDRLGQQFPDIQIVNLHYENTVETDVYRALRRRIGLFERFVGKLQPILAAMPKAIATAALTGAGRDPATGNDAGAAIVQQVADAEAASFDLDELTSSELDEADRPEPAYDLNLLDAVLRRPDLLPPGVTARSMGSREYEYSQPGMHEPLRVTTSATYYDQHPDSVALWSPGSPLFPQFEGALSSEEVVTRVSEVAAIVSGS